MVQKSNNTIDNFPELMTERLMTERLMSENAQNALVRIEPIFVGIEDAAAMLGLSATTLNTMDRTGKLGPLPIHINTILRRLYKVCELRQWAEAGCPIRERWQAMRRE